MSMKSSQVARVDLHFRASHIGSKVSTTGYWTCMTSSNIVGPFLLIPHISSQLHIQNPSSNASAHSEGAIVRTGLVASFDTSSGE